MNHIFSRHKSSNENEPRFIRIVLFVVFFYYPRICRSEAVRLGINTFTIKIKKMLPFVYFFFSSRKQSSLTERFSSLCWGACAPWPTAIWRSLRSTPSCTWPSGSCASFPARYRGPASSASGTCSSAKVRRKEEGRKKKREREGEREMRCDNACRREGGKIQIQCISGFKMAKMFFFFLPFRVTLRSFWWLSG